MFVVSSDSETRVVKDKTTVTLLSGIDYSVKAIPVNSSEVIPSESGGRVCYCTPPTRNKILKFRFTRAFERNPIYSAIDRIASWVANSFHR